ncbi:MAG: hypothetical protein ACE5HS_22650 [bacterium]
MRFADIVGALPYLLNSTTKGCISVSNKELIIFTNTDFKDQVIAQDYLSKEEIQAGSTFLGRTFGELSDGKPLFSNKT